MKDNRIKVNAWMRVLEITLISKTLKKKITFGNNWEKGLNDLNIKVEGSKYLSSLKDRFTVTITNLTYKEITELIAGQFYSIEIKAGYRTSPPSTIFKGGVLYISNVLDNATTNSVVILCASEAVSKYGQKRMNLSYNSGINMYSAISYICKKAGCSSDNAYIDNNFKSRILKEVEVADGKITNWLDLLCEKEGYVVSTDSTNGSDISIWNARNKDFRKINLTNENIILTGGYPRLSTEGLVISVLPTFSFCPGDVIKIDNSIINIGVNSEEDAYKNLGQYLDDNGNYVIYQIDVNLENRGSSYSYTLNCKSKSLYSSLYNL